MDKSDDALMRYKRNLIGEVNENDIKESERKLLNIPRT